MSSEATKMYIQAIQTKYPDRLNLFGDNIRHDDGDDLYKMRLGEARVELERLQKFGKAYGLNFADRLRGAQRPLLVGPGYGAASEALGEFGLDLSSSVLVDRDPGAKTSHRARLNIGDVQFIVNEGNDPFNAGVGKFFDEAQVNKPFDVVVGLEASAEMVVLALDALVNRAELFSSDCLMVFTLLQEYGALWDEVKIVTDYIKSLGLADEIELVFKQIGVYAEMDGVPPDYLLFGLLVRRK